MRYIMTLIWGVLLGEVVSFLVGALNAYPFDPKTGLIGGLIASVAYIIIATTMTHFDKPSTK